MPLAKEEEGGVFQADGFEGLGFGGLGFWSLGFGALEFWVFGSSGFFRDMKVMSGHISFGVHMG